ncbi:MAG: putative LPS assembly protein LptD [Bacteroidota bacterium]
MAFLVCSGLITSAQDTLKVLPSDTLTIHQTALRDTLKPTVSKTKLDAKVEYTAFDSIRFDIVGNKVFLWGNAKIKYKDLELEAAYIEVDFKKNMTFASFHLDSAGEMIGKPQFKQSTQNFSSEQISYNFNTKRGIIKQVITKQGEGYLHGTLVKKLANDVTFIKNGAYTTCDLDDPHFEIKFSRAKVIPNNKIVTGPAYLRIEGVPTPVMVPFGFFPNKKGRKNGILIPSYGESTQQGFYFHDLGYYFGFGDYMDAALKADIYTRGSWGGKLQSNYNYRYHFSGTVFANYSVNYYGTPGASDYLVSKDFSFRWTHNQSEKARPRTSFSANVNIMSNRNNKFNPLGTSDYLSNTYQSGITYAKNWSDSYYLTINLRHSQNTITHFMSLGLPELAFSVNTFYPFRKKDKTSDLKWYDNISVGYSTSGTNALSLYDTIPLSIATFSKMITGMQHNVPIRSIVKVLKYFNWSNSIEYVERWYLQTLQSQWKISKDIHDPGKLVTDTLQQFASNRNFSFSSGLSTKLYGMYQFKNGSLKAIRHVVTPSLSFSYHPDFTTAWWGYYKYYVQPDTSRIKLIRYSPFATGLYDYYPDSKSGAVNINIANNLEIKVRNRKDTVSGTKKIVLIDNFTITTGYDIARDSLNWNPLALSGRTTLFKRLQLSYYSQWDYYALDSAGLRVNKFEWDVNHKLLRMNSTNWLLSLDYNITSTMFKKEDKDKKVKTMKTDEGYLNAPWNIFISYSFQRLTSVKGYQEQKTYTVVQSLSLRGEINLTKKWKISATTIYDFKQGMFPYASVDIYRDLHCWEMKLNWIPVGFRKSWNFQINVKSSVLQDLKLTKKKDFTNTY